eukprot:TRINITY_DN9941_c0_g1_i6.p2 TRINITY_DN9941_c0_g1~~TRINITY_DN9941_c0_g1_i6.p2  ORF type:complete len:487 (-),score=126.24 TRINITY_DN9941_c0_g1_i6:43-1503(-)
MKKIVTIGLSLLCCAASAALDGFVIGLTSKGAGSLLARVHERMTPLIENLTLTCCDLGDVSGSSSVPVVGDIQYSLSNFKLSRFDVGDAFWMNAGNPKQLRLWWTPMDAQLHLDFSWYHDLGWGIHQPSGSGSATVLASNGSVQLDIELGDVFAKVVQAEISFAAFDVQVNAQESFVYQFLLDTFHSQVEALVNRALENEIQQLLDGKLADFGDYLPQGFSLLSGTRQLDVELDYDTQTVTNTSICLGIDLTYLVASNHSQNSSGCVLGTPTLTSQELREVPYEAFAIVEAGSVNCALGLMSNSGLLNHTISLPRWSAFSFLFPFHTPYLAVGAVGAPSVDFNHGDIDEFRANVTLAVEVRDKSSGKLLGLLEASSLLKFNVSVSESVLNASTNQYEHPKLSFELVSVEVQILTVRYGSISFPMWIDELLSKELGASVANSLHNDLGDALTSGIAIPVPAFLGFKQPHVRTFGTHFMLLSNLTFTL